MIDLTKIEDVKIAQSSLREAFKGAHGKDAMELLELICGWYNFTETTEAGVLIGTGKRQVLATIKTLLKCSPEEVIQLTKENIDG